MHLRVFLYFTRAVLDQAMATSYIQMSQHGLIALHGICSIVWLRHRIFLEMMN